MRIVMLGTGPFAVPSLRALLAAGHEIAAVVTRPPRAARGEPPANPMMVAARELGLPVEAPETVNSDSARAMLAAYSPELLVVCDYGEILKPETLAQAPRGGINLHGSLLPKYRGAAPVNWAVWNGDPETGVTVIHMTPRLDAGPTIAIARTPIGPDETVVELEPRLAAIGADLVVSSVAALAAGTAVSLPQDSALASKAPRLKKENGLVDWNRSAQAIKNQVRALVPWPTTYTFWKRPGREPMRLILSRVQVAADTETPAGLAPGAIVASQPRLLVATGAGALEIVELQPAGKRVLAAAEFLRGQPLIPGEILG